MFKEELSNPDVELQKDFHRRGHLNIDRNNYGSQPEKTEGGEYFREEE